MNDFENPDETTNRDKFLYVLSYIPFVNISLFFLEVNRPEKLQKFLQQWVTLFAIYIVVSILLGMIWGVLASLFTLWYLGLTVYLASQAYQGNYIENEYLKNIIDRIFQSKK